MESDLKILPSKSWTQISKTEKESLACAFSPGLCSFEQIKRVEKGWVTAWLRKSPESRGEAAVRAAGSPPSSRRSLVLRVRLVSLTAGRWGSQGCCRGQTSPQFNLPKVCLPVKQVALSSRPIQNRDGARLKVGSRGAAQPDPRRSVLRAARGHGVTALPFVFQVRSSLTETFTAPATPTTKPSNPLPSTPATFYHPTQHYQYWPSHFTFIIKTITIKTKSSHKWCLTFLYRILPWKNFFLVFNLRLSFLKYTSNPKGWKLFTTAEHCKLPHKHLTDVR